MPSTDADTSPMWSAKNAASRRSCSVAPKNGSASGLDASAPSSPKNSETPVEIVMLFSLVPNGEARNPALPLGRSRAS